MFSQHILCVLHFEGNPIAVLKALAVTWLFLCSCKREQRNAEECFMCFFCFGCLRCMERKKGREEEKESKEWGKKAKSVGSRERRKEGGKGWKETRCSPGVV